MSLQIGRPSGSIRPGVGYGYGLGGKRTGFGPSGGVRRGISGGGTGFGYRGDRVGFGNTQGRPGFEGGRGIRGISGPVGPGFRGGYGPLPRGKVNFTSSPMGTGSKILGVGAEFGLLGFILGFLPTQGPAGQALGTIQGTVIGQPGSWPAPAGSRLIFLTSNGDDAVEVGAVFVDANANYQLSIPQGSYQAALQLPGVAGVIPIDQSPVGVIAGQVGTRNLTFPTAGIAS